MAWNRKAWAEAAADLTPRERRMLVEKYDRYAAILSAPSKGGRK